MAAVAIITGVLAALTVPSMIGMQARTDLQGTASQIKGAFQEAQRSAIRTGAACTVKVATTGITGSPAGCISSPVTLDTKTTLTTNVTSPNASPWEFQFNFKGNSDFTKPSPGLTLPADSNDDGKGLMIILSRTNTSDQRCIIVTSGIGIMRSGLYSGGNCTASF